MSSIPAPYELVRSLGQGGFGEVFLVRDPVHGLVAMKRLARLDPGSIARFKNEFRLLQGLRAPALPALHELTKIDDGWYLVMEFVAGEQFNTWVRPGGEMSTVETMPDATNGKAEQVVTDLKPYDEDRLREALRGLASGLVALHDGGLIHRDLKPSNVLITAEGRVVILDFGLAAAPEGESHHSLDTRVMGTPGYIAPEQAQANPITRAADWYAVGVMLFEALTGRRPYIGSMRDIVHAQLHGPPADPAKFAQGLPEDLRQLCMRLLSADPAARPDGSGVLTALGDQPVRARGSRPLFVGRAAELATMITDVGSLATRGPLVTHLVAPSGFGKSALLARALGDARSALGAVVLAGRCYEREALPFKAIDPLVDALTDYLRRQTVDEVLRLLPRDAFALVRMFPTLGQIDELADAPETEKVENPEELRRRAIGALREMFARIADRHPLVLAIDDFQWGCLDSAKLLGELFAPPGAPRALLVLCQRPQEQTPSSAIATLRTRLDAHKIEQHTITLGPLLEPDAEAMARAILPPDADDAAVQRIRRESGCNPLFVAELARAQSASSSTDGLSLDAMIARRLDQATAQARRLLEIVCATPRAIDLEVLRTVAATTPAQANEAISELEQANLARRGGTAGKIEIEPIHDRIREVVVTRLPREAFVATHRALAEAMLETQAPEAIADHFRLAGDLDRARPFALRGARAAVEALALDRAIALCRDALEGATGTTRFEVLVELGDALSFDGRGLEAAEVFREAIALAPTQTDAVELEGRVAHHLLASGRIDDGLDTAEHVLSAAHVNIPRTPRRALVSLLYQRARLRIRGLDFEERTEVPRELLAKIDACWAVSRALSCVDLIRSADIQSRHLRFALEAGEPYRIARGLALEGILLALDGTKGLARAEPVLQRAEEIAQEIGHPHAMAWAHGASAVAAWCVGRWRDCASLVGYSIALLRSRCMDNGWEICTLETWLRMRSLLSLGEIATATADVDALALDATRRDDLYTQTTLHTAVTPYVKLFAGHPDEAATLIDDAIAGWSTRGWFTQHQEATRGRALIDLYRGEPVRALELINSKRSTMKASLMLRMQNQRILLQGIEAVAAIHSIEQDAPRRATYARTARDAAASLRTEDNAWASAVAAGITARLAFAERTPDAAAELEVAEKHFADLEMKIHEQLMRRLRGELVGGSTGSELVTTADRELSAAGVAEPAKLTRWLA